MGKYLPNTIIIGAEKAGTTYLKHILKDQPDIFIAPVKEVHFFDFDSNWDKGLGWYSTNFEINEPKKAILDITPAYLSSKIAAKRIKDTFPNIKLIVILRNPIDRAYSNYWMDVAEGKSVESFEEVLKRKKTFIERGKYKEHLQNYLSLFNKEQLLILLNEELSNPDLLFKKIAHFLEIKSELISNRKNEKIASSVLPKYNFINKAIHIVSMIFRNIGLRSLTKKYKTNIVGLLKKHNTVKKDYPPMKPETRNELYAIFKDDIDYLEKELGLNVKNWRINI